MGSMAEGEVGAMETMVGGEVGAGRQRVLAARARFLATRDRIVPLSRQAVELALNAYITGQQPLVSVLDAVRTQGEVQMDSVRAEGFKSLFAMMTPEQRGELPDRTSQLDLRLRDYTKVGVG